MIEGSYEKGFILICNKKNGLNMKKKLIFL